MESTTYEGEVLHRSTVMKNVRYAQHRVRPDKGEIIGCLRRPDSGPVFNSRARAKFHPMSVEQLRFKDPPDFGDAITKFGSSARAFLLVSDPNSALRSYFFQNWANFCPLSPQKKTILVQVWSCLGLVFQKYMLLAARPEGFSVVPARHTVHGPIALSARDTSACRQHGE